MNIRSPMTAMVAACSALLLVGGCGQSAVSSETSTTATAASTSAAPPGPPAPAAATITIQSYEYSDATVAPGGQVTVENLDADPHTVTSNTPGVFNVEVGGKAKAMFTAPAKPGSYPFHCDHHASMHGMLTVQ